MPQLSRWFIRTALAYLLITLVVGVLQPLLAPSRSTLWSTYVHLLVLGWLTQLIFGVAHWMFPRERASASPHRDWLGWGTYGLLNLGLLLRFTTELGFVTGARGALFVVSALLQLAAGLAFIGTTWPRVRGR